MINSELTATPKGISLHIGLNSVDPNHYVDEHGSPWKGELNACHADAMDMQSIANSQGYTSSILLSADATRAAVTASISEAASKLKSGDIFLLTYSGHGGKAPDLNGDEEDDTDETWCLYDGELIDDELHELFAKFAAGVRIFMLSDSCHSGTVSKEQLDNILADREKHARYDIITGNPVEPKPRGMPLGAALKTYQKNKAEYDKILEAADPKALEKVVARVRLISGCMDEQTSADGAFNGRFTGYLKKVWNNGKFEGNYEAFHKAIYDRMPAIQKPNHYIYGSANPAFDEQRPFQI